MQRIWEAELPPYTRMELALTTSGVHFEFLARPRPFYTRASRLNERRDYKRAWPGQEAAVYVKMADNRE